MRKNPEELLFMKLCYTLLRSAYLQLDGLTPREIINNDNFPVNYKRCWYFLEKWTNKDWYEYGVSSDTGWLTPKGYINMGEMLIKYNFLTREEHSETLFRLKELG